MTTDQEMTPDRYLREEVARSEDWYDRQPVRAKARFLRWRVFSVVGGAAVPVLANLPLDATIGSYPLKTLLITLVSLGVVIAVSLEGVFHYGDQWKNFRSAQTTLRRERLHFKTRTGAYAKLEDAAAFRLLVERIEAAMSAETSSTLSAMAAAEKAEAEEAAPGSGHAV
jgi:uncharacterized membrane protein YciS (DUF1049 family)